MGINRVCISGAEAVRTARGVGEVGDDEGDAVEVFELSLPLLSTEDVTVVVGGEDVRKLFNREDTAVRSAWPSSLVELLGPEGALLNLSGDEHRRARRAVAGAISSATLEAPDNWLNLQRIVGRNLARWAAAPASSHAPPPTVLIPACRRLAFEVAVSSAVGPNANLSDDQIASMQEGFDASSMLSDLSTSKALAPNVAEAVARLLREE